MDYGKLRLFAVIDDMAGLLRKNGYEVSFREFMKTGGPYTLTAVSAGYLYFWLLWR